MTPERWQRIKEVFQNAMDLAPDERQGFVARVSGADAELRRQVERMIHGARAQTSLFDEPAVDIGARLLRERIDGEEEAILGQCIGRHRLVRQIGRGGMGTVYLAEREDGEYREQVAIKLIKRGMDTDAWVRRFRQERQILADLDHPNIARLLDGGVTDDGRPYLVMEHIAGVPLDRYCHDHQLTIPRRLELFQTVCAAVQAAHRSLVVHCDLKPSNILVTEDGTVKLVDFGIARLLDTEHGLLPLTATRASRPLTPEYASPEQVRGLPLTTATDVYSLGAVLYELLTERLPFTASGKSVQELERSICNSEPSAPSTSLRRSTGGKSSRSIAAARLSRLAGDLDNIVLKALRKEPAERYGSAQQLADDLHRHLAGLPVLARPQTLTYRLDKFLRRHWVGAAATVLIMLSLLIGALVATWQAREARKQQQTAHRALDFLVELFEVSDPESEGSSSITLDDVLAAGAANVGELSDEPQAQALLMDTIGQVYRKLGDYERAEPLLLRALGLRDELFGPLHEDVVSSMTHVGVLRLRQGELEAAENLLRDAIEIGRQIWNGDHAQRISTSNSLALVLKTRGDVDAAEAIYRDNLKAAQRALGDEHRLVASTLNNLAVVLRQKGRFEEAEDLYRQTLALRRELFGDVHLRVASSLNNLAVVLRRRGAHAEAEPLLREALAMQRQLLGDEHPELASTLANLASSVHADGRSREAEPLFRQALAMQRQLLGDEHPDVVMTLSNLAVVLRQLGELEAAEETLRQALDLWRKSLGEEHSKVADTMINLAILLRSRGQDQKAEKWLRQAVALHRQHRGNRHPSLAWGLTELGRLLLDRGAAESAEEPLREALDVRRQAGESSSKIAHSEYLLGSCLLALERPSEAEAHLIVGFSGLEASFGKDHPRTVQARQAISALERILGRPMTDDETEP